VLEVSELWREVVENVHGEYKDVTLSHMYVDNAAMQLVREPNQFDVVLTGNMFGDILSDAAAMLTGSIGMLPSASLDSNDKGMYEPIHGSAPDIAGKNIANPLATILSIAMMLRYSLNENDLANKVEQAVQQVIVDGLRTADIADKHSAIGTNEMGDAVIAALN
jgi:3-isopropylmalate dehydrogenase